MCLSITANLTWQSTIAFGTFISGITEELKVETNKDYGLEILLMSNKINRSDQIREELANIEAQLLYTKTQILIDNCKRTKQILEDELKTITGSGNQVWPPNDQKDNNHWQNQKG